MVNSKVASFIGGYIGAVKVSVFLGCGAASLNDWLQVF